MHGVEIAFSEFPGDAHGQDPVRSAQTRNGGDHRVRTLAPAIRSMACPADLPESLTVSRPESPRIETLSHGRRPIASYGLIQRQFIQRRRTGHHLACAGEGMDTPSRRIGCWMHTLLGATFRVLSTSKLRQVSMDRGRCVTKPGQFASIRRRRIASGIRSLLRLLDRIDIRTSGASASRRTSQEHHQQLLAANHYKSRWQVWSILGSSAGRPIDLDHRSISLSPARKGPYIKRETKTATAPTN